MSWFPIGPDFVYSPRSISYRSDLRRLSRRNEYGEQGAVVDIALEPAPLARYPVTIYVIVGPAGGTSAFRTQDHGVSWVPIVDSLQRADAGVDPSCIAINSTFPNYIYMGTFEDMGVYVSDTRGDSWRPRVAMPNGGKVRKLIVEPRPPLVPDPATAVLYAATTTGIYRSAAGGTTWTRVLDGDVWSFTCYYDTQTGVAHYYAGVGPGTNLGTNPQIGAIQAGVYYTTDPTMPGNWINQSTQNAGYTGTPAYNPATPNFEVVLVQHCPRNPNRVYAWFGTGNGNRTFGLYTAAAPLTDWTIVPMDPAFNIAQVPPHGYKVPTFAVAPNSPGDGATDILFFGAMLPYRSIDAGHTWTQDANFFHVDQHAFAFHDPSPGMIIPSTYVGCDGGIALSTGLCDRAFAISPATTDFNEGCNYDNNSGLWQNLNHGMQSSAVFAYASDPAIGALSYIGCQDTGLALGTGSLGWRGNHQFGDLYAVAARAGLDGVKVWGSQVELLMFTDKGEYQPAYGAVTLGVGGLSVKLTPQPYLSNQRLTVEQDGTCLACVSVADPVTAVDQAFVARVDQHGVATRISQFMAPGELVVVVAANPVHPNVLYCCTNSNRLLTTNSGSTASSNTVWNEIVANHPGPGLIAFSIAIDQAENVYVLFPISFLMDGITSPLFRIDNGAWAHQPCSGLPTVASLQFGKLVADPVQPDLLYATHGRGVYKLTLSLVGTVLTWNWEDISSDSAGQRGPGSLPGNLVFNLWIGNIGTPSSPKIVLRAAIPGRGVWERDVTPRATNPSVNLYVRSNILDPGWFGPHVEGVLNPYDPREYVWHYQCADLKIDARQSCPGVPDFFQTDPEGGSPPISHVLFDQLKDNSENLPTATEAMVHVQVHNRSWAPANAVKVWAIYADASAGMPALSASASLNNSFNFWSLFTPTGDINANLLPQDSPWTAVGLPVTLSGIDAANPQVASWLWTVPTLPSGNPGHYCMVAFVHSASAAISETSMEVDDIARRNKQVGQKNLHIIRIAAPLSFRGDGRGGAVRPSAVAVAEEYIEFHNATSSPRVATLTFDLRRLPAQLEMSFKLTPLDTVDPLNRSVTGVADIRWPGLMERITTWIGSVCQRIGGLVQWIGLRIENRGRRVVGLPARPSGRTPEAKLPDFAPAMYQAAPSERVEVKGVRLSPFGSCAALFWIRNRGTLEEGSEYWFDVQQDVNGRVVGGSTYVVRIAGERKVPQRVGLDSHRTEVEVHA